MLTYDPPVKIPCPPKTCFTASKLLKTPAFTVSRGPQMVVLRIARGVTDHFVGRWPEWILSSILMGIGLQFLRSADTFSSSPSFDVMKGFATEDHWGVALCIVASIRLIALILNGTFKPFARYSPIARSAMGCFSGFAWFSISLGLYLGNPDGTGFITYAGLLMADIINSILAAGDAGAAQRKYGGGIRSKCS